MDHLQGSQKTNAYTWCNWDFIPEERFSASSLISTFLFSFLKFQYLGMIQSSVLLKKRLNIITQFIPIKLILKNIKNNYIYLHCLYHQIGWVFSETIKHGLPTHQEFVVKELGDL